MYNYMEELAVAFKRTTYLGLQTPNLLNPNLDQKYLDIVEDIARHFDKRLLAGEHEQAHKQCFLYSLLFCDELKKRTGEMAWLTIGYMNTDVDGDIFKLTEENINSYLSTGHQKNYKGHCWVTIPEAMSIVDLTFKTTYLGRKGVELPKDSLIIATNWQLLEKIRYHPLIVGDDYIYRSNILQLIPTTL